MRHLVIPTDGRSGADHLLAAASQIAGPGGTLVLVSVLPGSLVDRRLPPPERGRRRRDEENRATRSVLAQIARVAPQSECHVIALFGEVVADTVLVVGNLGADAVVMGEADPDLRAMQAESPVPVVVVPDQADAPE